MNICQAPLTYSFSKQAVQLLPLYAFGLVGIFGWGLIFETFCHKRFRNHSYLHAYLEGTVIVSLLMLIASCFGYTRQAFVIAALGILMGIASTIIDWKRGQSKIYIEEQSSVIRGWEATLLVILMSPLLIFISVEYIHYNDLAYIWSYHGKVLSCEPLFQSDLIKEKFWAGTHPEYPLYLPLLFSYFFTLADSFRDDFVKIWEAVSVLVLIALVFINAKELYNRNSQHTFIPWAAAISLISVLFWGGADGRIELNCLIFMYLVTMSLLLRDWGRLSLYLFALGFCKNESFVAVHLFVVLHIAWMLWRSKKNPKTSIIKEEWHYLVPWAVLDIFWLFVAIRLPNNHEQYTKQLLNLSAWYAGWARIPEILEGSFKQMFQWPWITFFLFIPLLFAVIRKQSRQTLPGQAYLLIFLWQLCMSLMYMAIFIVTPWNAGVMIHALPRLIMPFYPVVLLFIIGLCFDEQFGLVNNRRAISKIIITLILCFHLLPYGYYSYLYVSGLPARFQSEQLTRNYYLTDPASHEVIELDKTLPLASRGAILNHYWYFDINYLLYPRKLYSASPDTIALTWRPYKPWTTITENEVNHYKFKFVVDMPNPANSRILDFSEHL